MYGIMKVMGLDVSRSTYFQTSCF